MLSFWSLVLLLTQVPGHFCYHGNGGNVLTDTEGPANSRLTSSSSASYSPNIRYGDSTPAYTATGYLPLYFQRAQYTHDTGLEPSWYTPGRSPSIKRQLAQILMQPPFAGQQASRPFNTDTGGGKRSFNSGQYTTQYFNDVQSSTDEEEAETAEVINDVAQEWSKRTAAPRKKYHPNWSSLDTRKLPQWYEDAKFGIFVHWGVYSVPAFNSEWLWWHWKGENPEDEVVSFMEENYPQKSYQDLATELTGKYFDADEMAKLVEDAGAKYFVFTSKHHEGFTHWKSDESWNWNSVDLGPKRDIVGELRDAFVSRDKVKFGLYFSLYEWFDPWYLKDKKNDWSSQDFVKRKVTPQLLELVKKYKPSYIWSDGEWEAHSSYWNSTNFLAWLYNKSPVRDEIVVNDRWGKETLCKHGDVKTCKDRYKPDEKVAFKWENAMTIDKKSWGYRKEATSTDYYTTAELIKILIETVSYGGNLLMNIAPTADGRIIPIYEDRMRGIGRWLKTNGEAIYGTRLWRAHQERSKRGNHKRPIWYTRKDDTLYAMITNWPSYKYLTLHEPEVQPGTKIQLLGYNKNIMWETLPEGGVRINIGEIRLGKLAGAHAWTFRLENIE